MPTINYYFMQNHELQPFTWESFGIGFAVLAITAVITVSLILYLASKGL